MEVFLGKQNRIFVYLQVFDKVHPNIQIQFLFVFIKMSANGNMSHSKKNIRKFKKFSEQRLKQIQNKSPKCNVV